MQPLRPRRSLLDRLAELRGDPGRTRRQGRILTPARTTPSNDLCHRTFNDTRHEHEPSQRNRVTQDENATMVAHRAVEFCVDDEAPTLSITPS
jgi:hypothetical protein